MLEGIKTQDATTATVLSASDSVIGNVGANTKKIPLSLIGSQIPAASLKNFASAVITTTTPLIASNIAGTVNSLSFDPGTPVANVIYRANAGAGTYTHFLSASSTPIVVVDEDGQVDFIFNTVSGYWTKAATPRFDRLETSITDIDEETLAITDEIGDIIVFVDENGLTTTNLEAKKFVVDNGDFLFSIEDTDGNKGIAISAERVLFGVENVSTSLYRLTVGVLGDSISDPTSVYRLWWQILRDKFVWTMNVSGESGTAIGTKGGFTNPFTTSSRITALGANGDPHLIFIFGGTNDFGHVTVPLGTSADTTNATFYGAVKNLYVAVQAAYPYARIIHITPLHRADTYEYNYSFPETNSLGTKLQQYVSAIKEIAELYGVSVINAFQESGISYQNALLLTAEGLHPDNRGHEGLAQFIEAKTKTYFQ